ncbi:EcsC family protein [Mucilaginibacter sp. RS28]|uniref:EcsC family protein n=1 Tax=Mucilaginibacter straminoryzae TaxID=2932774 RepID=A0A9X1X374_9SPHI|nr:EcsC family protein [Mucilaginibacter straminoryzae]MCJ8209510.1 EcsC family protein [Mucilaginibacter straminoryzae]
MKTPIKLPKIKFDKVKADLREAFRKLSEGGFQQIFNHIDQLTIKRGVDKLGLDGFINQCAILAAGSGAVAGIGGISTMIIGIPLDLINLITQQFRVTMAISYHRTGEYKLTFEEFIIIVATAFKVDTGVTVTKAIMEEIAEKMMLSFGSKTAERLVPVVGAVIGGAANYLFIKRMAEKVKELKGNNNQVIHIK